MRKPRNTRRFLQRTRDSNTTSFSIAVDLAKCSELKIVVFTGCACGAVCKSKVQAYLRARETPNAEILSRSSGVSFRSKTLSNEWQTLCSPGLNFRSPKTHKNYRWRSHQQPCSGADCHFGVVAVETMRFLSGASIGAHVGFGNVDRSLRCQPQEHEQVLTTIDGNQQIDENWWKFIMSINHKHCWKLMKPD